MTALGTRGDRGAHVVPKMEEDLRRHDESFRRAPLSSLCNVDVDAVLLENRWRKLIFVDGGADGTKSFVQVK